MVATIIGKGAGFENSSVTLLGGKGQVGTAVTGASGEAIYVNGATGNLVLTTQDVTCSPFLLQSYWSPDYADYGGLR